MLINLRNALMTGKRTPTTFRYVRMTILKTRSTPEWCQLSDIRIPGFSWPSGTSVTALVDGSPGHGTRPATEGPSRLIDNNVNTKYCQDVWEAGVSVVYPLEITIDLGVGNKLDILQNDSWSWYTANDVSDRDPVSFQFWGSEDNNIFYKLDEALDKNITTSRKSLAYTGNLIAPV